MYIDHTIYWLIHCHSDLTPLGLIGRNVRSTWRVVVKDGKTSQKKRAATSWLMFCCLKWLDKILQSFRPVPGLETNILTVWWVTTVRFLKLSHWNIFVVGIHTGNEALKLQLHTSRKVATNPYLCLQINMLACKCIQYRMCIWKAPYSKQSSVNARPKVSVRFHSGYQEKGKSPFASLAWI